MPSIINHGSLSKTRSQNAKVQGPSQADFKDAIDLSAAGDRKSALSILLGGERSKVPEDWRVRISTAPMSTYLYNDQPGNDLMSPLVATRGVVFPYTPRVTMAFNANYDTTQPTHSNYPIHTYKNSGVAQISITGDFTAQTPEEARYMLAAMMFFRASTKMFWGNDDNAGQPPPVLYLNGYGTHFLPNVPIVITNFSNDLPDDLDYVEAYVSQPQTKLTDLERPSKILSRLPARMTMTVGCEPVYSRRKVHDEFTFENFARGNLIGGQGAGGGGFI